ncbi:unnamed protein product [Caenorhabditis brenneri]
MKKAGSKESGSNCERTKSSCQVAKKKGTVRQTKKLPATTAKPQQSQNKAPPEKEKKKSSARKRVKSNSTSTDTNKSSDKCNSQISPDHEHPDEQSDTSNSNNLRSRHSIRTSQERTLCSREDTSNLKTSIEQPKSRAKSLMKTSEEKEDATKKEEKTKEVIPSEKDELVVSEKDDKKFNMHLAQLFFKRMNETQKGKKNVDPNLEVMPESIYLPRKPKNNAVKKSTSKNVAPRKPRPLDQKLFLPDGKPVWQYIHRDNKVECSDGVMSEFPELREALLEDDLELESGENWKGLLEPYLNGKFDKGRITDSLDELDPYGTFDELESRTKKFFKTISMQYYTVSNLANCAAAIDRSAIVDKWSENKRKEEYAKLQQKAIEERKDIKETTCPVTKIMFNMESTFMISYDRRRPILSIQKFRAKYQRKVREALVRAKRASRETKSREGSRERPSKESS